MHNDNYSFGELQIIRVLEEYDKPEILNNMWIYDDGILKGLIHIIGEEVVELYVDYFFWKQEVGSVLLYEVNQGRIGLGQCIDEQLLEMGIKDSDIDAVLITHLDCDHANGLKQVKGAKKFMVSADEVKFANKVTNKVRYYKGWWEGIDLTEFEWNDTQGPVGNSYDLLGDSSIELINIPGHADGLYAVKIKNEEGKFVLLFSDGGYARKS